ncbi:hypothetical protein [Treponema zioleckii]|uniref:hypothetical protein n=1 Tax=Treponema zioleckii TaxID=331680 RepID=UPI00168B7518|nr:hypothetical protein [Treponema zioleckii]
MGIEELEEKIANLNKATVEKSDRRDLLIARRNKAFYNQKKYFIKMQKEDCDSQTYEELKKKYEMQSEIWKKQNERLNKKFVLSPTNTKIAEELGIDRRKIYFCINHTKSEEYLEFFKKLVRDEDEKNDDKKES